MNEVKRGQEYWELMEKTAAIVDKWPDWKKGIKSNVKEEGKEAAGRSEGAAAMGSVLKTGERE